MSFRRSIQKCNENIFRESLKDSEKYAIYSQNKSLNKSYKFSINHQKFIANYSVNRK